MEHHTLQPPQRHSRCSSRVSPGLVTRHARIQRRCLHSVASESLARPIGCGCIFGSGYCARVRVVNNFTIDFTDTFTTSPLGWGIYVSKFSMIRNSPTLVLGCGRGRDDTYHPHPSELGVGTYHFLILSPPAHLGGGFTYQGTGRKTYHE